jgi:hypothetical protein
MGLPALIRGIWAMTFKVARCYLLTTALDRHTNVCNLLLTSSVHICMQSLLHET